MICKNCWEVFTANLFKSSLVDDAIFQSIENGLELENAKTGAILTLKAIESTKLTQDEFDYLKKNKDKFYFIGRRKEYKDEIGFSKIEWN